MTAFNYLYVLAIGLVVMGWGMRAWAEDDVTILAPPVAATNAPTATAFAPDGTPVIHKSFHKKSDSAPTSATVAGITGLQALANQPATVVKTPPAAWTLGADPAQAAATASGSPSSLVPTVETGLPIARHSAVGSTTVKGSTPIPTSATLPSVTYGDPGAIPRKSSLSSVPSALSSTTVASYSPPSRELNLGDDSSSSLSTGKKGPKNNYPWKTSIITTVFWIGEGGSTISPTDNVKSSWDEEWMKSNGGTDSPTHRNGYASAFHAATLNPFYIALPFNDLAFPDKAKKWLPAGWHRPPKDGKQVSACKDRWVEIKAEDGSGHTCYAQWEDVGPLRYDHAEYVFGPERPDTYTRAGLDVSPAVAQYLNINSDKKAMTRWRFVDDNDVPPGAWLKYEEEHVLYQAFRNMKSGKTASQPIQKSAEPTEDVPGIDSTKKKVGAAKG